MLTLSFSEFDPKRSSQVGIAAKRSFFWHTSFSQTFDEPVGIGQPFRVVRYCSMLRSELSDGLGCCGFEGEVLLQRFASFRVSPRKSKC